jgi:hypothetical protein
LSLQNLDARLIDAEMSDADANFEFEKKYYLKKKFVWEMG